MGGPRFLVVPQQLCPVLSTLRKLQVGSFACGLIDEELESLVAASPGLHSLTININRRRYGDLFNKLAAHVSRLKSLRFLRVDAVFTRFLYEPQKILAEDTLHTLAKHGCLEHVQFGRSDIQELVHLAKEMSPKTFSTVEKRGRRKRNRRVVV